MRKKWITKVRRERAYGEFDSAEGEEAAVNGDGVLNVTWPETLDGSPIECDVLLATATGPTIVEGKYRSAREIAESWNTEDGEKEVHYFWNNRDSEITTFEDDEIIELLNVRRRLG